MSSLLTGWAVEDVECDIYPEEWIPASHVVDFLADA